jgi:hypothetical protein
MKCSYCGRQITYEEDFIDLKAEGCIHSKCLEEYNNELSEIINLNTIAYGDNYSIEDTPYDLYEGDD